MYENRTASVYDGRMTSHPFSICRGTTQGGILSRGLYLVFMNDLLILLSDSNDGLRIGNRSLACRTQAEDIALLSTSKRGLESQMDIYVRTLQPSGNFNTTQTNAKLLYSTKQNVYTHLILGHGCYKNKM